MYVVGLVGPMGSGKSQVLQMLARLGAQTLRADDASRELLSGGSRLVSSIGRALGEEVLCEDGSLNRKRTAQVIFSDPVARTRLEQLTHPPMVQWLRKRLEELSEQDSPPAIVVIEAAILTHMGARPLVDAVVRLHAPEQVCARRVEQRDGISPAQARERVDQQRQMGLFDEAADFVVDTSGSIEETRRQIEDLWARLVKRESAAASHR